MSLSLENGGPVSFLCSCWPTTVAAIWLVATQQSNTLLPYVFQRQLTPQPMTMPTLVCLLELLLALWPGSWLWSSSC